MRGDASSMISPLEYQNNVQVDLIFGGYQARRDELMASLVADGRVTGVWSESIFPRIKDFIRYGADAIT